ncbi:hypothetical protein [Methylobacterium sp. Leaf118]|uniref:hypothetical protein n=1 Tax=Methylobacterium sp. Leaf118 TaxID=2876562 RepID=UPI001E381DFA|nr:hypothetical protein [Methylobacterium sp. Leaf118]
MRKGMTIFAALVAASLAATPLVMGASALATSNGPDTVETRVAITPVEIAPVAAPAAPETCTRKVRVVYSGYAAAPAGCLR